MSITCGLSYSQNKNKYENCMKYIIDSYAIGCTLRYTEG